MRLNSWVVGLSSYSHESPHLNNELRPKHWLPQVNADDLPNSERTHGQTAESEQRQTPRTSSKSDEL